MEQGDPFTSDDIVETTSQSDVEEDSDSSSDEDYSPGLLVIDTGGTEGRACNEPESVQDGMEEGLPGEEEELSHNKSRTNRSYTIEYKVKAVEWHRQYGENWSQSARHLGVDRKRLRDWERDYDRLVAVSQGHVGLSRDSKRLPSSSSATTPTSTPVSTPTLSGKPHPLSIPDLQPPATAPPLTPPTTAYTAPPTIPPMIPPTATYTAPPTATPTSTDPSKREEAVPVSDSKPPVNELRLVSFVGKEEIFPKDKPTSDTVCLYTYHWGTVSLDVITRREETSVVPVKNIYEKVIPGLKRNVLSARISKLGIRSLVFVEPYISALKRLGLSVTGSSHYMTIIDIVKICKYFKIVTPDSLSHFSFITSDLEVEEVLQSFVGVAAGSGANNPPGGPPPAQNSLLGPQRYSNSSSPLVHHRHSDSPSKLFTPPGGKDAHGSMDSDFSPSMEASVDARRVCLPNGTYMTVLVRGGVPHFANADVIKLLPSVGRIAMEHVRNSCGITVQHATKAEIGVLKYLGVVGVKAGRSLLYSAGDVAKMFAYWKSSLPEFIRQLCKGKLPDDRIDLELPSHAHHQFRHQPHPHGTPPTSQVPRPYPTNTHSTAPTARSHAVRGSEAIKLEPNQDFIAQQLSSLHNLPHSLPPISSASLRSSLTFTQSSGSRSLLPSNPGMADPGSQPAYSFPPRLGHVPLSSSSGGTGNVSMEFGHSLLTPEQFQQPVQMLSSLHHQQLRTSTFGGSGSSGAVFGHHGQPQGGGGQSVPLMPDFMSPLGTRLDISQKKRRRTSSTSGPSLDDQDLEYSTLAWGEQLLTLLCPPGEEPYLAVPELITKVFHYRSYMSVQRRLRLGVITVPATSVQIHALRARGSVDAFTGNTKLITLSSAVKLAVDGNFRIPSGVVEECKRHCKEPIEYILTPTRTASTSSPAQPPLSHLPPTNTPKQQQTSRPEAIMTSSQQEMMSDQAATMMLPQEDETRVWAPVSIPVHPEVINLGPSYHTTEGMMCQVVWGSEKLVVYVTNRRINYMGLFQVYDVIFKQYVTRMNFKMRMRKLAIRSIRAPSGIRLKLIDLNALPHHSPVCGLITISEMEHLAKSYGVIPPSVFYEAFLTKQQQPSSATLQPKLGRPRKKYSVGRATPQGQDSSVGVPQQLSMAMLTHRPRLPLGEGTVGVVNQKPLSRFSVPSVVPMLGAGIPTLSGGSSPAVVVPSSAGYRYGVVPYIGSGRVNGYGADDDESLTVSIPRRLTRFRLTAEQEARMTSSSSSQNLQTLHSQQTSVSYNTPVSAPILIPSLAHLPYKGGGSVLQNLAKKISQKSRKFSSGSGPGPGSSNSWRHCPSCQRTNPPSKKRCEFCGDFLIGRPCPSCGALNHNRTKGCFKCHAPIPFSWEKFHFPPDSPLLPNQIEASAQALPSNSEEAVQPGASGSMEVGPQGQAASAEEPKSPSSPRFSAPPIRTAVLKNMFPQVRGQQWPPSQEAQKGEDGKVMTQTLFSGNLASSRRCLECGALNSKMAKKCLQCRSPVQGRPCPRCGRPNLSHTTECYKCHGPLTPMANKWVYVGSHSGRAYKNTHDATTPFAAELQTRAPISCLRCHKLRSHHRLKCGRCGDVFETKPVVVPGEEGEGSQSHPLKGRRVSKDTPAEEPDPSTLMQLAHNLLNLDIGEQLAPIITEVESQCREKVYTAEEEFEAIEEQYLELLRRRESKEAAFQDVKAELDGLLVEIERFSKRLGELSAREAVASEVVGTCPEKIAELKDKLKSAAQLL